MGSSKARLGPEFTKLSKRSQALPSDSLSNCLNPIISNQSLATFSTGKNLMQNSFHKISQSP
jgi:hypothetical protein